jgi:hypothetical protein
VFEGLVLHTPVSAEILQIIQYTAKNFNRNTIMNLKK